MLNIRSMGRVLGLALLAAVVAAAGASARSEQATHGCVSGGEVRFVAADGTRLVGHRFGKGTTAVILGHQSDGDLCEWLPYARRLAGLGYFAFAIDFRGSGLSQPRTGAAADRLPADLAAAAKALRRLGKRKVFFVGASMGGIASLVAGASVVPPVDGVVSLSAPARFRGMDAVRSAPKLRVPVLYLAAEGDDNAGYDFSEDARAMHAATAAADKRLEILPGRLHGIALLAGAPRARSLVERFLKTH